MRIQKMDVGIEGISRWQRTDEVHLPEAGKPAPIFLPQPLELDELLRRPSMDQQLLDTLEPDELDSDLLHPTVLANAREAASVFFEKATSSQAYSVSDRALMNQAKALIDEQAQLDAEVQSALALLLRA